MFVGPQMHCSIQLTGSHLLLWHLWGLDFTAFSFVLNVDWIWIQFILRLNIHIQLFIYVWSVVHHSWPQKFLHITMHSILNFFSILLNCSLFTVSVYFNCDKFSSFNVHGSWSIVTRLISSFCPIYLFYIYVLYRTQYTYKIHCITGLYIQWNHLFQYIFYRCLYTLNHSTQTSISFWGVSGLSSLLLQHLPYIPHTSYLLCGLFNSQIF